MDYAITKGEQTLKELVLRLFRLPDKSAKTIKNAGDALLAANPDLKDMSKVPAGTVIQIPSTAPPMQGSEKAPEIVFRRAALALQAQQTVSLVDQRMSDLATRAAGGAEILVAMTKSPMVQGWAKNSPDLAEDLSQLTSTADSLGSDLKTIEDARNKILPEVQKRLQSFLLKG